MLHFCDVVIKKNNLTVLEFLVRNKMTVRYKWQLTSNRTFIIKKLYFLLTNILFETGLII